MKKPEVTQCCAGSLRTYGGSSHRKLAWNLPEGKIRSSERPWPTLSSGLLFLLLLQLVFSEAEARS